MPKGVELSHKALTAYVVNTQSPADPSGVQDATLVAVPLFHIAGATTMLGSIWSGRKLTILPAFDPSGWLSMVEKEKVTHAMVVPTMLKRIMEVADFDKYDISSLQLITYGAAPMPYEVVRKAWRSALSDAHPDRARARGLPAEFIEVAEAKAAAINAAFRGGVTGAEIPLQADQATVDALAQMTVVWSDLKSGQELGRTPGQSLMGHPLNAAIWWMN